MKNIFIPLSIIMLMLFSCKEDTLMENTTSEDFIALTKDTLMVGPDGGVVTTVVESSGDWRLSGDADWAVPSVLEGKNGEELSFTVSPNESQDKLEYEYKVFTGSAVKKVLVISSPVIKLELLSEDEVVLTNDSSVTKITLKTNVPDLECKFSGDGEEWIRLLGDEDVLGKKVLSFSLKENTLYKPRASQLTISGGGKSVSVDLTQEQTDTVLLEKDFYLYDLAEREIALVVKSNISYDLNRVGWDNWATITENEPVGEVDENGLQEYSVKIRLEASEESRKCMFEVKNDEKVMLTFAIKQEAPNAEFISIPDNVLRKRLEEEGWIISGLKNDPKCELLQEGKTATYLDVSSGYGSDVIESLEGIEAFTQLETMNLGYNNLTVIDISKLKKVNYIFIGGNRYLQKVLLGENPVKSIDFWAEVSSKELIISGDYIESISADYASPSPDELLETFDITQCPSLKTCAFNRSRLKVIYVTQEQMDNVDFSISEITKLVVK